MTKILTITFGAILAVIRCYIGLKVPAEKLRGSFWVNVYKDIAHVFIGGIAAAWLIHREDWQWWLFWVLNFVEIAVAAYSRRNKLKALFRGQKKTTRPYTSRELERSARGLDKKSKHQHRVEQFMRKAGQDVLRVPTIPTFEIRRLRAMLIMEEALETVEALGISVYALGEDLAGTHLTYIEVGSRGPNLIEIADGCADLIVVTTGTLSACGISDEPLQLEVDESNLRKFGPGGFRNADGKWIKPADWKAPDIRRILKEQNWRG